MKLRKTLLSLLAFLTLGLASATAQNAMTVMDRAASKLNGAGGIKAGFTATTYQGAKTPTGTTTGTICVEGGKFKVASQYNTTWFNGTTQWALLNGGDEVYVSTPTASELQSINPYTFVNLYKKGYKLSMTSGTYSGKATHEVRMVAKGKGKSIPEMRVTIDKNTYMPHCIRVKMTNGNWVRIQVTSVSTGQHWDNSFFEFTKKDYPAVEGIDLR